MGKLVFDHDPLNVIEVEEGGDIISHCENAGVPFACAEGICGTCVIEVIEGMENFTDPTPEEKDMMLDLDRERLACQCRLKCGKVKIKF